MLTPRRVHAASLLVGFLVLLWSDHKLWFGGDEWAMVSRSAAAVGFQNLFAPHNEHWSTVVVLEYRALLSLFGLRTYIPYLLVLIAAQVVTAHLLWRLMLRTGVQDWVATALAGVFVVLGSGAQALQNAFNFSFVGAVCAGIGALLLVSSPGARPRLRNVGAVALMLLALMCSAPALAVVLAVGLFLLLRRGWRATLGLLAVPAVVYLGWFAAIGHEGTSKDNLFSQGVARIPNYVLTGISNVFSLNSGWSQLSVHLHLGGTTLVGALLAVALFAWLGLHWRKARGPWAAAYAGVVATVFFYVVVAFARTRFGASQATQTRYVYVAVALLLPALGLALTALTRRAASTPWAALAVIGCLGLITLTNLTQLTASASNLASDSQVNRSKVLGTASLLRSGSPIVDGHIVPSSSYLTPGLVRSALRRGWLPQLGSVTEADRLDAQSVLQVSGTARPRFGGPAVSLTGVESRGFSLSGSSGNCMSFVSSEARTHTLSFAVPSPMSLRLELTKSALVRLILSSEGKARARAPARTFTATRRHPLFLNFLAGGLRAKVAVASRNLEVCGTYGTGFGSN